MFLKQTEEVFQTDSFEWFAADRAGPFPVSVGGKPGGREPKDEI